MQEFKEIHMGRSWTGSRMEDECPCPQETCGLVSQSKADPECLQHYFGRSKTMRQIHSAEDCERVMAERKLESVEKSDSNTINL